MKLRKEYKKSSGLFLWSKTLLMVMCALVLVNSIAHAEPIINDIPLPPVSFSRITDRDILNSIGLDPTGGAWCYEDEANAILITAPARERSKCELKLMYELEKQKVKYQFELDKLNLRIGTLTTQHAEINLIKDREIEKLSAAALKRPNDYSVWWATGGLVVGIVSTVLVTIVVKN